ncbi:MAG: FadR family transcriptional regulator [Lachnospiraceae bacterium]|nr:FadR family transcriptional regulator [Lachnospiraceae bacterium]
MAKIGKMNKRLLAPQIEDQILTMIREQPIPVGEKIPNEFELAELFGVGRSTIREAVKSLVTQGVLEVRRGSGTFVLNTETREDDPLGLGGMGDKYKLALELVDVRLMLEPEIAVMACERITEEEKKELVRLCDEVERVYLSGGKHTRQDVALHSWIARCSGNRVVEILIPIINSAVYTFVNLTQGKLQQETITSHRAIVDAILAGDRIGARTAMMMHLTYNRQKLLELKAAGGQKKNTEE